MFKHVYINSLKIYMREKTTVFWLLIFPMVLAIFFKIGFSNLMTGESFETIPVVLVENEENTEVMTMYRSVFAELSDIFSVTVTDREEAERLLLAGETDAFITVSMEKELPELCMTVKESGMNQSIVRAVLNKVNEGVRLVLSGKVSFEELPRVMETENVLHNVQMSEKQQDYVSAWFYTILGMAAMYGSMLGITIIKYTQANQSAKAMRFNLAPVSKMKGFGAMFAAGATLHSVIIILVYLYLDYIIGANFGDRQPYILLVSVIGCITGISIGATISMLVKGGEMTKLGVCMAVSMTGSFLAGMMDNSMKYVVMRNFPAIEYINPAGILTDSYLKLYYYEDLSYFWGNVLNLLIITAVCMAVTIFLLRRQRYDNI